MDKDSPNEKRVLVVEDEPGIAVVCRRILNAEGFQVDIAVNGKAALDMWREKSYDLCLTDIRTPEMNGMELYQHLEREFPEAVNKVIFATGDVLNSAIKAFLAKTTRPFLAKPFTPDALRNIVRAVLANADQSHGGLANASNRKG